MPKKSGKYDDYYGKGLQELKDEIEKNCKKSGKSLFTKGILFSYLDMAYAKGWKDREELLELIKEFEKLN
jgi:hypothetical protein